MEAIKAPFQRGKKDLLVVDCRSGNDLACQRPPPQLLAGLQVKTCQVMLVVALAVGKGHQQPAAGNGRHAHEGIAQPLLPDRLAVRCNDLQFAAFGVEGHAALGHDGRGRSIIAGLIPPEHLARLGVEGIELVAAEAAADEELPLDDRRGGQGMIAGIVTSNPSACRPYL